MRPNGIQRQLEMAGKSALEWAPHKKAEAERIFKETATLQEDRNEEIRELRETLKELHSETKAESSKAYWDAVRKNEYFEPPQPNSSAWWEERQKREKDRLNELTRLISDDEIEETSYEDTIICPYCGYDDSDDRYDGEGSHTYWCGRCDEEYECEVHVTVRYSTVRVNPKRKE